MDRYKLYGDSKVFLDIQALDQKTRGLCELVELNIRVPYFFIVPHNCFLVYHEMPNELRITYIQNIVREFEEYINAISENEAIVRLYSLRCPDKTLNNETFPFPETVLNIGYNEEMKKSLTECYGDKFCKKVGDTFVKHAKKFSEHVCVGENIPLLQLNEKEQLKFFISSLYRYFEEIFEKNKDLCYSFILQTMVYGNMDDCSLTGMCYTRNPYTGDEMDYGRYIINRQGISLGAVESKVQLDLSVLKESNPAVYDELKTIMKRIEDYYNDIHYLEYTVQSGKVYILQNTVGNRTFILPKK